MKIETTLARNGVCANCGGRGCVQCRLTTANNECPHCGGVGCVNCRAATADAPDLSGWTEVACHVAQTNPSDWIMPRHLLSLSLLDCVDGNAMLMLSIMPDEDEPGPGWEGAAIVVAMDWWKHIQHAPDAPDHFTVTTFDADDDLKLIVAAMIPKAWDAMSFFELSKRGLNVTAWADAMELTTH